MDLAAWASKLEGPQALDDDLLEIGLAGVDHVVDPAAAAEPDRPVVGLRGRIQSVRPFVLGERLVVEVPAEEAEFPHLVGDILADIGHRAVAPDDDFFPVLLVLHFMTQQPALGPSPARVMAPGAL